MEIAIIALKIAHEIMKKMPDYDQKKRSEFYKMTVRLEREWNRPYPERDDDLILNLRSEAMAFLEAFYEEIKK